jgi:phage terminase small subunit
MKPDDEKIRSRADDIEDKPDGRGDVLPTFPAHTGAEFRLAKERTAGLTGEKPLSFQEEAFIRRYFANGFVARDAAKYARIPYQSVAAMIRQPHVRAAMDRIQRAASEELKISQHRIIGDLFEMFTCDLTDVVEHRRGACRYCWGTDGKFHWRTEREREQADAVPPYSKKRPTEADPTRGQSDGGTGFDQFAAPNPDCQECAGQGESVVLVKDTAGRKGVASVEFSPNGKVLIKTHDKAKLGELLLKHLAMALHDESHKVQTTPQINAVGGIAEDFNEALRNAGTLEALEKSISEESKSKVSAIEIAAREKNAEK